ncbi:MAG: hypothetical protein JHC88_24295 [Niveispirillum sp.]|nr:hypothetical protein [Niveispirillum sp.]
MGTLRSSVAGLQRQQRRAYQALKVIMQHGAIDLDKVPPAEVGMIQEIGAEIIAKKNGRPRKPTPETLEAMSEVEALKAARKARHG